MRRAKVGRVIKRLDNATRSKLSEQDKFHTDVETGGGKHAGRKDTRGTFQATKLPSLRPYATNTDTDNILGPSPHISVPFESYPMIVPSRFHRDSRLEKLKLQLWHSRYSCRYIQRPPETGPRSSLSFVTRKTNRALFFLTPSLSLLTVKYVQIRVVENARCR